MAAALLGALLPGRLVDSREELYGASYDAGVAQDDAALRTYLDATESLDPAARAGDLEAFLAQEQLWADAAELARAIWKRTVTSSGLDCGSR